jgi:hypothetical protein
MCIEISVSQELKKHIKFDDHILIQHNGCSKIIEAFQKTNLEGKFVPNLSIMNQKLELGCTITKKIWNTILESSNNNLFKDKYSCAHLKIDGQFNGCIFNYLKDDKCPHKDDFL